WVLNFHFIASIGNDILNQYASDRLNFINNQKNNTIRSVKGIRFWQKRVDYTLYPHFNPWSAVVPFRSDQDLFLEDGSYLKLRSLSVSYDLSKTNLFKGDK